MSVANTSLGDQALRLAAASSLTLLFALLPPKVAPAIPAARTTVPAAPTKARKASAPVVPLAIAAVWQPLRPRSGDPSWARSELKAPWKQHGKKQFRSACMRLDKLHRELMKRAAGLFYRPVRKGADLGGISAFMTSYVHGTTPLLAVAHEAFVPSAPVRNLAVDACMRAGLPVIARRFVDHAAASSADQRLRTAAAVVRMAAGKSAAEVSWLVGASGGGARASLVRAVGAPGAIANQHIAAARKLRTLADRSDVETVAQWLQTSGPRK